MFVLAVIIPLTSYSYILHFLSLNIILRAGETLCKCPAYTVQPHGLLLYLGPLLLYLVQSYMYYIEIAQSRYFGICGCIIFFALSMNFICILLTELYYCYMLIPEPWHKISVEDMLHINVLDPFLHSPFPKLRLIVYCPTKIRECDKLWYLPEMYYLNLYDIMYWHVFHVKCALKLWIPGK